MMTAEMIQRAKDVAEELFFDYGVFAVRVQSREFTLGSIRHCSHVWIDGTDTGAELDGICAQTIDTLDKYNNFYFGDHIAVIAGNDFSYGDDPGEVIIEDAVVVEILA